MTEQAFADQYAVNKDGLIVRPGQTARWQMQEWTVEEIHRHAPDGPVAVVARSMRNHEREYAEIDGCIRVRVPTCELRTPGADSLVILL